MCAVRTIPPLAAASWSRNLARSSSYLNRAFDIRYAAASVSDQPKFANTRRTRRQFMARDEAGRIRRKFRRTALRAGPAIKKNKNAAIQISGGWKIAGRLRT